MTALKFSKMFVLNMLRLLNRYHHSKCSLFYDILNVKPKIKRQFCSFINSITPILTEKQKF